MLQHGEREVDDDEDGAGQALGERWGWLPEMDARPKMPRGRSRDTKPGNGRVWRASVWMFKSLTSPVSDTVPILRVRPRVAHPGPTKIDSVRVATPPDASRCLSVFKTPSL